MKMEVTKTTKGTETAGSTGKINWKKILPIVLWVGLVVFAVGAILLLAVRKRAFLALYVFHSRLLRRLLFIKLALDVLCNPFRILPCRICVVPAAPELPVQVLVLLFLKPSV